MPPPDAYAVLSPEAVARVDAPRWQQQARTFLEADVQVVQGDPAGAVELDVAARGGAPTRVRIDVVPIARAPEIVEAARRGVAAIGGAGFDVLVARAQTVWLIEPATSGDPRASLVAAALLASVLLGPIVPPDEETIYGVRGARMRLAARGWPPPGPQSAA